MKHSAEERVIALAGIFQAASMVNNLAKGEILEPHFVDVSIDSLLMLDAPSTLAIYGDDLANLQLGLVEIVQFWQTMKNDATLHYVMHLIILAKHIHKQPEMLKTIAQRLKHIQYKREHFSEHNDDILSAISGLYQDTVSTLAFRIHVTGDKQHLTQKAISDKIRCLLFAGLRAAILWQQVGGTKWQLIFQRKRIVNTSKQLLATLSTTTH